MLLPLLQRFASQMRVSLYHTPDLRGLLRLLVPQRFNETIGLQHIKVYLFDDSIIISGCVEFSLVVPHVPLCLRIWHQTRVMDYVLWVSLHNSFLVKEQVCTTVARKCSHFVTYAGKVEISGCAPKLVWFPLHFISRKTSELMFGKEPHWSFSLQNWAKRTSRLTWRPVIMS